MLRSAPTLNKPRSSWSPTPRSATSWKHGDLVPVRTFFVTPGEHLSITKADLIQMNTPKQAFADDIECFYDAFYVPARLTWLHFEEFMGANKTGAGPSTIEYHVPHTNLCADGVSWDSLSKYLGKPVSPKKDGVTVNASILKERGYYLIWNNYYRASMLQNPVIVNLNDSGSIGTLNGQTLTTDSKLLKVNKARDYITMALLQPLYGQSSVSLPLGTKAPVYLSNDNDFPVPAYSEILSNGYGVPSKGINTYFSTSTGDVALYADLEDASAAPIDAVRYALATEAFLHNAQYGGSTYWGQNLAHYGVSPSDKSLQIPQLLGSINYDLNVTALTQISNTNVGDGVISPIGSTGAVSKTGHSEFLFSHDFEEFGFVYILCYQRVKRQSYSQNLKREDFLFDRLEWFSPEFNNIGDDILYNKEVYVDFDADNDNDGVFGYQEHDAYLKYYLNETSGIFTPGISGVSDDTWTFTNNFDGLPELNGSFLVEDRDLVASKLITGTNSNYDYFGFFVFDMNVAKEVAVISDPMKLL